MTKKLIIIIGSALIGIITILAVIFSMIAMGAIQIEQTTLVFSSASAEIVYSGDTLTANEWEITSGELKEGHTAKVVVSGKQTTVGSSENSISATIVDENGADVTDYYKIEYQPGMLRVFHRKLQIMGKNATKAYDGTPLTCQEYTIVSGDLPAGHIIVPSYPNSITDVGKVENVISAIIKDANGNDVTSNYDLVTTSGELTVTKRAISLQSESAEKIYDGTALTRESYSVLSGELVNGHTIYPTYSASITNVGTILNEFVIVVKDGNGKDVTQNYDVTLLKGSLTVLPIQITISTGSSIKTYDGTPLTNDTWEIVAGNNPESDTLVVVMDSSITSVGTIENDLVASVQNQSGEDVTRNYAFTFMKGTLTIIPQNISLLSGTAIKVYDGTPLSSNEVTLLDCVLPDGHTLNYYFTKEITNVGSIDNEFTAIIRDGENNDVTNNFEIDYHFGTLTVNKFAIGLYSESASKVYDGTALTKSGVFYIGTNEAVENYGPIEEYSIVYQMTGSQTNVGESENSFAYYVLDASSADVTDNFDIDVYFGTLTVTTLTIGLYSESASKVYDGTALTKSGVFCIDTNEAVENYAPIEEYSIVYQMTGSQTNVGESENSFAYYVLDASGVDVTDNFDIDVYFGTLTVTTLTIGLYSESASKVYDGTELTQSGVFYIGTNEAVENYGPIEEYSIVYQMTGSQTNVGESENSFAYYVLDANGEDVTENFDIDVHFGTLTVNKFAVGLYSESASKLYDGTELTKSGVFYMDTNEAVENYGPIEEYSIVYQMTGSQTIAGSSSNTFNYYVLDASGVDVTENFNIDVYFGTLTVTKFAIGLYSESASKVYDGTELTQSGVFYMDTNEAVENYGPMEEYSIVYQMTGSQTMAGSSSNTFNYYVLDARGVDVTENFDIDVHFGTLTVMSIQITCKSNDITELYSDETIACTVDDCQMVSGDLVSGYTIQFFPVASSIDVCTKENNFYVIISDENGKDVTSNYDVRYIYGTLRILPRSIKVITPSANHTYDGEEFFCHEYKIEPIDALVEGHNLAYIEFSSNATLTNVGTALNSIACLIIENQDGKDVTRNYSIDYSDIGEINVTPRPITIRTADDAKYYDGTPLTNENWELVSLTQPIDTHVLEVAVSGTITEIGQRDNVIAEVRITDTETGENVTYNYAITKQLGKLVIKDPNEENPGSGTGTGSGTTAGGIGEGSGSGEIGDMNDNPNDESVCLRVYSTQTGPVYLRWKSFGDYNANQKKWDDAIEYNKLIDGKYSMNYLVSIALKNTGIESARLDIESYIQSQYFVPYFPDMHSASYDVQSSDVLYTGDSSHIYSVYYYLYSGYYTGINANLGQYASAEYEYRQFVKDNYLYVDPTLKAYMQNIIQENGFNSASNTIVYDVASYIQQSANYNLQYNRAIDYAEHPIIAFLTEEEGICSHYASAATALFRTLGIPARYTIGFTGNTRAEQWIDITAQQAHAWTEIYIDGIGWVPVEVTGSSNSSSGGGSGAGGIGGIEGDLSGGGSEGGNNGSGGSGSSGGSGGSGSSGGSGGSGGSGNQDGDSNKGITITPKRTYYKYDGKIAYPINEVDGLASLLQNGFTYNVTVEKIGALTNLPGIYETKITSFALYNKSGEEVTGNYTFNFDVGYMQIYLKEITVRTSGGSKTYDGTALISDRYVIDGDLLSGHTLKSLICVGKQLNVGKSANNFSIYITDSSGKDVTSYYKINRLCGTLTVMPKSITVTANSNTKVYDGTALVDNGYTLEGDTEGYTVEIRVVGSQTNIGYSDNIVQRVIVKDKTGKDVTLNFSIEYVNGKLFVTPPIE